MPPNVRVPALILVTGPVPVIPEEIVKGLPFVSKVTPVELPAMAIGTVEILLEPFACNVDVSFKNNVLLAPRLESDEMDKVPAVTVVEPV